MAGPRRSETEDTGRKAYLEPGEPPDGERSTVVYTDFRKGYLRGGHGLIEEQASSRDTETEDFAHNVAAETHPKRPDESPFRYIQRLSGIARKKLSQPVQVMPRARQTRREQGVQLQKLRAQVDEDDASTDWWQR